MTTTENPHAGQGSVLLDIGGDVGALVVTMPEVTLGREVEIRPVTVGRGVHDHLVHVAVVARPLADTTVPSLVFPELAAGTYDLFVKGEPGAVVLTLGVEGGRVTWADWPEAPTGRSAS